MICMKIPVHEFFLVPRWDMDGLFLAGNAQSKQFNFPILIKVIYHQAAPAVSDTVLKPKRAEHIKPDDYHFLYPNISYIFAKYDQKIIRTKKIERNEEFYCLFY